MYYFQLNLCPFHLLIQCHEPTTLNSIISSTTEIKDPQHESRLNRNTHKGGWGDWKAAWHDSKANEIQAFSTKKTKKTAWLETHDATLLDDKKGLRLDLWAKLCTIKVNKCNVIGFTHCRAIPDWSGQHHQCPCISICPPFWLLVCTDLAKYNKAGVNESLYYGIVFNQATFRDTFFVQSLCTRTRT